MSIAWSNGGGSACARATDGASTPAITTTAPAAIALIVDESRARRVWADSPGYPTDHSGSLGEGEGERPHHHRRHRAIVGVARRVELERRGAGERQLVEAVAELVEQTALRDLARGVDQEPDLDLALDALRLGRRGVILGGVEAVVAARHRALLDRRDRHRL